MAVESVQGGQVLLVSETGHHIVGLRLQTSTADAAFRGRGQEAGIRVPAIEILMKTVDDKVLPQPESPVSAQPQGAAADVIVQRTRDQEPTSRTMF